jgi:hypothetical protein
LATLKERASVWFNLEQGRVTVKDPDEPTIAKMCAIAKKLAARVQGEEGEYYDENNLKGSPF